MKTLLLIIFPFIAFSQSNKIINNGTIGNVIKSNGDVIINNDFKMEMGRHEQEIEVEMISDLSAWSGIATGYAINPDSIWIELHKIELDTIQNQ